MSTDRPGRSEAIDRLLNEKTPRELAAAIVDALTPAGSEPDWDSETIEFVLAPLMDVTRSLDWPIDFNGGLDEVDFWEHVRTSI